MSDTTTAWVTIVAETCCDCGTVFGMNSDFRKMRMEDHKTFYCPNGHGQHYTGKTEADTLRDALTRATARMDQVRADAEHQRRQAIAARGQVTKIRNRVQAGVCPCCNRHFTNLERHMATKHPTETERT